MLRRSAFTSFLLGLTACAGGPDDPGDPVTYCEAELVFEQNCVRCHHEEPEFGAPMSLETYADVERHHATIKSVVQTDFMPYTKSAIAPPVEPLSATDKGILIQWVDDGALDCK